MTHISRKHEDGFTLLEVLLGVAIAAFVLAALTGLLVLLLQSRERNAVVAEVEQQGEHAMSLVLQEVRDADGLTLPIAGQASESLTLDVVETSSDPLLVFVEDETLTLQEGVADAIPLTSDRVAVSSFQVQNLAASGTPGTVQVSFELEYVSPTDTQPYVYASTFTGSATLR